MLDAVRTIGFTISAFIRPHLGRAHLNRYRLRELKNLLIHAAEHVPFYRDRFSRFGFDPAQIRQLEDLHRIPLIGKQHLRDLRAAFSAETIAHNRLIEHSTSGSTGIPVRILRSPAEERRLNMMRWRLQWMMGLRPGNRLARVKTTWEPLSPRFNWLQNLVRTLGVLDVRVFDCFDDPAKNYGRIVDFQPHVLAGYPGALVRIALQHDPSEGAFRSLRWISCGGECLAPHQRRFLAERFGVPVHDVYGTSECNLAAWRCLETGHYHVNDDSILLEVCRDGRPVPEGQSGEIVITVLHAHTMPIIRYTIGDVAVAGPPRCACGAPFSTIKELQGRTIDFLPLPDGRELHPFELLNEIVTESADWVAQYQLEQLALDRFRLLVVPQRPVSEREIAAVLAALRTKLGHGCALHIDLTEHIPQDAGGKLHFCRSAVRAMSGPRVKTDETATP